MNVLLLNPPASRPYLRDYFCCSESKSGYLWHPIDLLIQSGFLSKSHRIFFIDGIAEKLSDKDVLNMMEEIKPDVIFSLVGSLSYKEDTKFLRACKNRWNSLIVCSGDILLEDEPPEWVDAVLTNFLSDELLLFIEGKREGFNFLKVKNDKERGNKRTFKEKFRYPVPLHKIFMKNGYRLPFIPYPFASILTSFGCPFRCSYCNSGNIGFSLRDIENIKEEVEAILSIGIRHIFIKDMTFLSDTEHSLKVMELMKKYGITYNCYTRAELVNENLLYELKRSGCIMLQIGVESTNEDALRKLGRNADIKWTKEVFKMAKKLGIRTGAHFIFGLPYHSQEDVDKTISFACELKPDYASFNVFIPRPASNLWRENFETLQDEKRKWLKKAYLSFLFRGWRIEKVPKNFRLMGEFLREGFKLYKNLLRRENG
jgi:radical SAM superfamily enzyme YgiQ (UPF0313 family)